MPLSKRGRPRHPQYEDLRGVTLNLNIRRFREFEEVLAEQGITTSENIRRYIEDFLEKNEFAQLAGETNLTNIPSYAENKKFYQQLRLDRYIKLDEARKFVQPMDDEQLKMADQVVRRIFRAIDERKKKHFHPDDHHEKISIDYEAPNKRWVY